MAVAVVAAAGGLLAGVLWSPWVSSTGQATFTAAEVGTAPAAQRLALADGTVTQAELEAAVTEQQRCLVVAGYTPVPATDSTTAFTVDVDYSGEPDPEAADREFLRVSAACEAEHVALLWRARTQPAAAAAGS